MTESEQNALLEALNVAVGKVLTEMYWGSHDTGPGGRLEAEILSYVKHQLGKNIEIGQFTRYYDDNGRYTLHLDVRLPVENSDVVLIEISKVVLSPPDAFDRPDVDGASDA